MAERSITYVPCDRAAFPTGGGGGLPAGLLVDGPFDNANTASPADGWTITDASVHIYGDGSCQFNGTTPFAYTNVPLVAGQHYKVVCVVSAHIGGEIRLLTNRSSQFDTQSTGSNISGVGTYIFYFTATGGNDVFNIAGYAAYMTLDSCDVYLD